MENPVWDKFYWLLQIVDIHGQSSISSVHLWLYRSITQLETKMSSTSYSCRTFDPEFLYTLVQLSVFFCPVGRLWWVGWRCFGLTFCNCESDPSSGEDIWVIDAKPTQVFLPSNHPVIRGGFAGLGYQLDPDPGWDICPLNDDYLPRKCMNLKKKNIYASWGPGCTQTWENCCVGALKPLSPLLLRYIFAKGLLVFIYCHIFLELQLHCMLVCCICLFAT